MKKYILPAVILLVICLVCAFYYNKNRVEKLSTENIEKVIVESKIDTEKFTGTYFDAEVDTPKENSIVAAKIMSYYKLWLTDSGIEDIKTKEQADRIGLSSERKYEYNAKLKIYDTDKYTSYVYEIYENTGGAHPNTYHSVFNFRKSDNKEIKSLTDIYGDNIYTEVSALSIKDLRSQFMANKDTADMISDLTGEMFIDGTKALPVNYSRFYFKDDNILTIIFDRYAIGPYVIGEWEVNIPLKSLEAFVR